MICPQSVMMFIRLYTKWLSICYRSSTNPSASRKMMIMAEAEESVFAARESEKRRALNSQLGLAPSQRVMKF